MNGEELALWLPCPDPNPVARLRLFCFPHGGAGAASFKTWGAQLPREIEVRPVQLPGRENRRNEPLLDDLEAVLDALCEVLDTQRDLPCAFFGHCMGALIAFELARRLRRCDASMPRCLLLSGQGAPELAPPSGPMVHLLSDQELLAKLREAGTTPEDILNNERFMLRFLPLARADAKIMETARLAVEPPLDCPIFIFAGQEDHMVSRERFEAWREHAAGLFALHLFSGGHFYIRDNLASVLATVVQDLAPYLPSWV